MYVLYELRVEKLCGSLVDITSLDLLVIRVQEWSHLRELLAKRARTWQNAPTKRTTPGFSDIKFFNSAGHGLNRRSESDVKGPQAIVMENDVSRRSCFTTSPCKADGVEGRRGGN